MNFLNNKYVLANGIAILMMVFGGTLNIDALFRGMILGFGLCLFLVTLYLGFKLMKE